VKKSRLDNVPPLKEIRGHENKETVEKVMIPAPDLDEKHVTTALP